jgi:stage III sporulation protein AD
MNVFLKAIGGVLITTVFCLILERQGKDIALLLAVAVCGMVITAAVTYLRPVIDFVNKLERIGQLDNEMLQILLKAVGIGLLTEITTLICADAGNKSLGKALQVLSAGVMLWISLPLLNQLLELIENILGAV